LWAGQNNLKPASLRAGGSLLKTWKSFSALME